MQRGVDIFISIWAGFEFATSVKRVWVPNSSLNLRVVDNFVFSVYAKFPNCVIQISVASKNCILKYIFVRLDIVIHEGLNIVVLDKLGKHADLQIFIDWKL